MSKPKLWHTADELKGYHGCSIIFLSWDGGYFHQASYYGRDFKNDMPKFQSNGLTVDNRDIWLWCERYDLFYKTNLIDLQEADEKKGGAK
jgi:hypothetical protein